MTERLADINTRIDGIGQLGVVVNAMRAIAAARAQQARDGLIAVDSYAGTIAAAIGHVLTLVPEEYAARRTAGRKVLLVFAGEEGFVGNFSERVLESAAPGGPELLFLVGSRGAQVAAGRDIKSAWSGAMPAHTSELTCSPSRNARSTAARTWPACWAGSR